MTFEHSVTGFRMYRGAPIYKPAVISQKKRLVICTALTVLTKLTVLTELTELTELTVSTVLTVFTVLTVLIVETVKTVETEITENLKKYDLLTYSLTY